MRIEWEGRTYDYDPTAITVRQAVVIRSHTGKGLVGWEAGVRDLDPQCLQALLWVIKAQNGEQSDPAQLDFPMIRFMEAVGAGAADEPAQVEPDPTAAVPDGIPGPTPISAT